MFSFFYNCILFLIGLVALPQLLWQWLRYGKYRATLSQRLGLNLSKLPSQKKGKVFWIHACSLGETKAAVPLYNLMRQSYPEATFVISNTTETGHAEAKKSMPQASTHFFLPLDFSFQVKKVVERVQPDLLILIESDFWYHLLHYAKKAGAKIALVNGKMSERSAKRFALFSFFARRLFSHFDCLCVQNATYKEVFLRFDIPSTKLHVTGNIKFDHLPPTLTQEQLALHKKELGILPTDRVVVIGSTHDREEEWLLSALDKVWQKIPQLKVLLVPRHPERFPLVAACLQSRGLSHISYTQRSQMRGDERVVLIDTMGFLNKAYQLGEVAIVGGSFVDGIGGHNVFEPAACGVPVLFGPYMADQAPIVDLVLKAKAGMQLTLDALAQTLLELLEHPEQQLPLRNAGLRLAQEAQGATLRSWQAIQKILETKD